MSRLVKQSGVGVLLLTLVMAPAFGQVNNQDEVVNVVTGRNVEGGDEMLKIYRPGTKADSLNYIVEFVELKYANSDEVSEYVDEAVGLEGGISKSLEYTHKGKTRYFLEIVTTKAQMPSVLKMVKMLDLPEMVESGGDPDFEVRMRYRRASEVGTILDALGVGEIVADDVTNTLHFEDSESKLQLLDFYDVPPLQIQFNIEIIEVWEEDSDKIGVDWDVWKKMVGGEAQYFGGSHRSPRLDWMLSLDSSVLADFLEYTVQTGNAEIKQKTVLNINNLETGVLSNTRGVTTYEYSVAPGGAVTQIKDESTTVDLVGGQTRSTLTPVSASEGITISITPVIGTELVTADIVIDADAISGVDRMDRPIISNQHFETSITLQDNQELLAATIERTIDMQGRRGLPGLSKVPGLKHVFSKRNKRGMSSKLFVMVKPCYCEEVSYDARIKGGAGEVLKFKDNRAATFSERSN